MAKKQTRRSISVSRETYERLRVYCETNGISMSQFVERRVGDFLGLPAGLGALGGSAPRSSSRQEAEAELDPETRRAADSIFTF
jgi:hypothetical protein